MINAQEYTDRLRDYFEEDMVKLEEPEDTQEYVYCTFQVLDFEDFDTEYWEPAVDALKQKIKYTECYTLEVFTHGDLICLLCSRGDIRNPLT